jgi:hypothetical protein
MKVPETDTIIGQMLNVWRFDFATKWLAIGISHIIDYDEQEIGLSLITHVILDLISHILITVI